MPPDNRFRHQQYTSNSPSADRYRLAAAESADVDTDEFHRRMQGVGDRLREAGVDFVYIVHGTFVGEDPWGLWTEISRLVPSVGRLLRGLSKQAVDRVFREFGNYTPEYARCFERAINRPGERTVPVRLFSWSGENNHIGRADGAVRLIDELAESTPGRALLWGHSHAGNLFALLTNLVGGDDATIERFFHACRTYYRRPLLGSVDLPVWQRVREQLVEQRGRLAADPPAVVTFGTPIRYGWESNGYAKLIHFVHHRPQPGKPEHLARFPPTADSVLHAGDGDLIQQFGIAGTNAMPELLTWRTWLADRRLNLLLQENLSARRLRDRLTTAMRVPDEGQTLLVDYGPVEGNVARHHAGHAVYTESRWMLFHAEQVCAELAK